MVAVRFERVAALPAQSIANTLYYVKPSGSTVVFQYAAGTDGAALPIVPPDYASLTATVANLLARLAVVEAALAAGGGAPSPFAYSLNFTDARNSMYVGALS